MTLALADANTARLLRALSLCGPTVADALSDDLAWPLELVSQLLNGAVALGAVRLDNDGRYQVDQLAVVALTHQNRATLLGTVE